MRKLLFIVNPCAGQKKILKSLAEVIGIFNQSGWEVTVYITAAAGDGTRIAQERSEDFDLVVCAGGDGTLNEVMTGVVRRGSGKPIGYIPCGTTNDFAATMGIPAVPVQAAQYIMEGQPVAHDVGRFGDRYFSYVASFGVFTRSSYSTPQNVKNALGYLAYWLDGISELAQIRTIHARFQTEDQVIEDDFLFAAVSNSTSVGGVLTLDAKRVDLQDGKFELLLVRRPKDAQERREMIRALLDQDYSNSLITFCSFSKLTVTSDEEIAWSLDGERADSAAGVPMEIENLQRGIQVVLRQEEA